jgi:hypothetical protein
VAEERVSTHWFGCWRAHDVCARKAVEFLAEGAMLVMIETLAAEPDDPNGRELEHRFKQLDIPVDWLLTDGSPGGES